MKINLKRFTLKKMLCCVMLIAFITALLPYSAVNAAEDTNQIFVSSTAEIHAAMKSAQPGDEIIIAAGTYVGKLGVNSSGFGSAYFNSDMSGTAENPIIIRSQDAQSPASLIGERTGTGYAFRLTGDYWIVKDINFGTSQKGIMLDNANHVTVDGCAVDNVGQEAIHLRDNSCYNLIVGCTVTNTGLQSAGFGEGIYVGSANSAWSTYGAACDNNTIRECTLGPGISAEHFDIKEGTTGTVVENCIMNGTGISGANYADSFIDVKGDDCIIRNNTCYRNGNTVIADAFQLHNQIDLWGLNNDISGNTVYMDETTGYVINATHDTSAKTYGNTRVPEGQMYTGNVTQYVLSGLTATLLGSNSTPEVGDTVTLTASAQDAVGGCTYRFSAFNSRTGVTTLINDYSSESTALWTVAELSGCTFTVNVKDSTGYIVSAQWSYDEAVLTPITITDVNHDKRGNFTVFTHGGSGFARYSCYIMAEGRIYTSVVRQSSNTITLSLPTEAGTYKVRIYAEDNLTGCKAVNAFTITV